MRKYFLSKRAESLEWESLLCRPQAFIYRPGGELCQLPPIEGNLFAHPPNNIPREPGWVGPAPRHSQLNPCPGPKKAHNLDIPRRDFGMA